MALITMEGEGKPARAAPDASDRTPFNRRGERTQTVRKQKCEGNTNVKENITIYVLLFFRAYFYTAAGNKRSVPIIGGRPHDAYSGHLLLAFLDFFQWEPWCWCVVLLEMHPLAKAGTTTCPRHAPSS